MGAVSDARFFQNEIAGGNGGRTAMGIIPSRNLISRKVSGNIAVVNLRL